MQQRCLLSFFLHFFEFEVVPCQDRIQVVRLQFQSKREKIQFISKTFIQHHTGIPTTPELPGLMRNSVHDMLCLTVVHPIPCC